MTIMKFLLLKTLRGSSVSDRLLGAAAGVFLISVALPPPAFSACQQVSIPVSYISPWDSHGIQNTYRLEESRYPDHFAGKGPYSDRWDGSKLMLSYNVLMFQIPV